MYTLAVSTANLAGRDGIANERAPLCYSLLLVVEYCSPACKTCDRLEAEFYEEVDTDEEFDPPDDMEDRGEMVPIEWGVIQNLGTKVPDLVKEVMSLTEQYMTTRVYVNEAYEEIRAECQNRHRDCSYWAALGESFWFPEILCFRAEISRDVCSK